MAKHLEQDQAAHEDQDRHPDSRMDHIQDHTQEETTAVENKTNMLPPTDHPSYTASIQKVLDHNLNIAKQDISSIALTATSNLPTQHHTHPLLTTLQRPIKFNIEWQSGSWLNVFGKLKSLTIMPTTVLSFPGVTAGAPTLAYWCFHHTSEDAATMTRFGRASISLPLEKSLGVRVMATYTYNNPQTAIVGPTIRFEPHESEIDRLGAANVKATTSRMVITKDAFGGSRYAVALPNNINGGMRVMWSLGHIQGFADGRLLDNRSKEMEMAVAEVVKNEKEKKDAKKREPSSEKPPQEDPYTIYTTQQLVDCKTGLILATYIRSAPWSKLTGTLTIYPKPISVNPEQYEEPSSELIESIIIVTAAMVDMQKRTGLLAGLVEAGREAMRWDEQPAHPLRSDP